MPVFNGQLILGDITIISVVSCTTLLMVCILFLLVPRTWSGNGADIPKEDSKTTFEARQKEAFDEPFVWHRFRVVRRLAIEAMIESKLLPWMFEARQTRAFRVNQIRSFDVRVNCLLLCAQFGKV